MVVLAWVDNLLRASLEWIDEANRGPLRSALGAAADSFLLRMVCGCVDNDLSLRISIAIR